MSLYPLLIFPAGLAVASAASGGTPNQTSPTNTTSTGAVKGSSASSPGATVGDLLEGAPTVSGTTSTLKTRWQSKLAQVASAPVAISDRAQFVDEIDAEIQAKLDAIREYGRAAYDKLTSGAKKEGASALNKELQLEPPLTGDESFDEVSDRIAGPIGATVGGAVGGAVGGPAGAVLGAMLGKYLGVKYEELLSKALPEIRDFFVARWSDIESWVSDKAGAVYDEVASWFT
jgi:hypothetical protein